MNIKLKLTISFLIGISGIILTSISFFNIISGFYLSSLVVRILDKLEFSSFLFNIVVYFIYFVFFSFIPFFFLSFFGIFLGIKSLNFKRKFAVFSIVLNSFNLFLSLLIAWLLFGLARGM
mgnify:CR=1 FL=1